MRKKRRFRWLWGVLAAGFLLWTAGEWWLLPLIEAAGEYRSQTLYDSTVGGLTAAILEEYGVSAEDLLIVRTNEGGEITLLSADTVYLNRLQGDFNNRLMAELRETDGIEMTVPWGSLFGGVWGTGHGHGVTVRLTAETMATIGLKDELTSVGINQTAYTLRMTVDQDVFLLYAGRYKTLTMHSEVLLAQTILVGKVPSTYVDRFST